jgi:alpha-amylase
MSLNGVIFQSFEWFQPSDGKFWEQLGQRAVELKRAGFTSCWLPPACKGKNAEDVGYGIYDLFDLGEFPQKGTTRSKYGTREQLEACLAKLRSAGLDPYFDAVLNHKNWGDATEKILVTEVNPKDRNQALGPAKEIEVWTAFDFPGRGNKYSEFKWRWTHFDCVGHNASTGRDGIFVLKNKQFETEVDPDHGNADFLTACDLDTNEPEVQKELRNWGSWLVENLGLRGFRLDAVKHIRAGFFREWLDHLRAADQSLFAVGEHWSGELGKLLNYLNMVEGRMSLFDVPLHNRFVQFGQNASQLDLRQLFDDTLVQARSTHAVTFVDNHDTQEDRVFAPPVADWFKPLAYASILLREGGYPCVFAADYDGPRDTVSHRFLIDRFLNVRRKYAFGPQRDYFTHPNRIGWMRDGEVSVAVVLNTGAEATHWMQTGRPRAQYFDHTGHFTGTVTAFDNGWAEFPVHGGSVAIFCEKAL